MKLREILSKETIRIPLVSTEKDKLIEEMVDALYAAGKIEDRDKVLKAVLDRERVMSTGVGDGVAIPHGKADGVKNLVASFGVTKDEVEFGSIDDKPVRLVFLLVGPYDQTGPHLKALSHISRLMHRPEFRARLIKAKTPEEVLAAIEKEEDACFG
ncbi:MAG: PTS sugar transporter subunit IIA [candidate division KSB1 bacterium]|nr:PTS sugar transporter subunit IIA [candidate division KSB1 bacterium]MDZ7295430.1 PTS sugar transporter subunit IIA [candidate division KSB1 bacterium]MDZ7339374.1 PTS sugar transporter subunit IIA [candidate division KSB1 bacterium]MDZ7386744.1 PTS sugar transporter subunit IIA [candidate division KSB1 bacterium]MDZ7392007.1 PTS sugar transporter subunit IIA [candidate division KSB1 bacterium]